jgi:hypothetical protein
MRHKGLDLNLDLALPVGLLPASLLACHLYRPLYSVAADGVRDCGRGTRLRGALPLGPIVLIDDTVYNGIQMRQREQLVCDHFGKQPIVRCAVYSTPQGAGAVDLIAALLPPPHYLEWNLANSGYLATTAWDLQKGPPICLFGPNACFR